MKEMHMLREFGTPRHWKEIKKKKNLFNLKQVLFNRAMKFVFVFFFFAV